MARLFLALVAAFVVGVAPLGAQPTVLQVNVPIEKAIAPNEGHEFTVTAQADQRLHIVVDQKKIDLVVSVTGPDGTQVAKVDNSAVDNGMSGPEDVVLTALSPGVYRVRVVPVERPDARPGRYTITLAEVRALTPTELANVHSEQQVAAIEAQWEQAVDKGDTTTMAKIMRDDAYGFAPVASMTSSKQQQLAGFDVARQEREKVGAVQEHTIGEHVIKAFGNTAVSTGRAVGSVTVKGETPIRYSGQFVHVWQKNESGWNLIGDYFHAYGRLPRAKAGPVAVDPTVLSTYAGTYQMEGGATMTVRVEGGKLLGEFSSPFGKSETPFDALTDTTFSVFAGTGEATFVRSPQGGVREVLYLTDGPAARGVKVR